MMICIAGKNDIAAKVLLFVADCYGADAVVAVANRDDTGHDTWQHSLTATAQRLGVRVVSLEEAYALPALHFFSVEFDRIVIPDKFRQAEIYNIHFSLLPRYKGFYTSAWPILNGDAETGVTLHRIDAGIDTGPIIKQATIPIGPNDTSRDVYHACLKSGYEVLREFIPQLVSAPVAGVAQAMAGSTYYSRKSIDYANLAINLRQTAYQIHNAVRAFNFQEYQLPVVLGRCVRATRPTTRVSRARPGTLLEETAEGFYISTIDFDLYLVKDYSLELLQAVKQGDAQTTSQLIGKVPDLEIRTRQGWTPLMMAAYAGNLAVVKELVAAGADVNAVNKKGTSVLMYAKSAAIRTTNLDLMRYLLKQGADARVVDLTNKSVLDYAREEGNAEVTSFIKQHLAEYEEAGENSPR